MARVLVDDNRLGKHGANIRVLRRPGLDAERPFDTIDQLKKPVSDLRPKPRQRSRTLTPV